MAQKHPYICEIAADTYALNEYGLAAAYLLLGSERALLIDTGCGIWNLPDLVAELTDKPCCVVLTHGHMDHAGGIGFFEEVYLNIKDWPMATGDQREAIETYARNFGMGGSYEIYEYNPVPMVTGEKTRLLPLDDGDCFDLGGGRVVEAVAIEGHTDGGMAFLDDTSRIIFSGDSCNQNLLATGCSVTRTRAAVQKFKDLAPRYDRNYNGHLGYLNQPLFVSQARSIPDDLLHICDGILSGELRPQNGSFLGQNLAQIAYGNAHLSYDPKRLVD